jgi:hypothetical protein
MAKTQEYSACGGEKLHRPLERVLSVGSRILANELGLRFQSKAVLAVAASLAIGGFSAGESAAKMNHDHHGHGSHSAHHGKKKKRCASKRQISFKLVDLHKENRNGEERFKLIAKSCRKTTPKKLKNVTLEKIAPDADIKKWKVKKFPPKTTRSKYFSIAPPGEQDSQSSRPLDEQIIVAKALRKNKRIGTKSFILHYNPETGSYDIKPKPLKKAECHSSPDFIQGIQDDDQFVKQEDISREQAFGIATNELGASMLRVFASYDSWLNPVSKQELIDTKKAADEHNYEFIAVLMPTPAWVPSENQDAQAFSFANQDLAVAQSYASDVALALGDDVIYELGNESNHPLFSAFPNDINKNIQTMLALRAGVKSVYPSARVITGGLAPSTWDSEIAALNEVPADGMGFHTYGSTVNYLDEVNNASKLPNFATEYGSPRADPRQAQNDAAALEAIRCAGFEAAVRYQEIDKTNEAGWNTGFWPPK